MRYTNFNTPLWYTLDSERDSLTPTRFLLNPLPYRVYSQMSNYQELPDGIEAQQLHELILEQSIVATENLLGVTDTPIWSSIMSKDIQDELLHTIVSLYTPNVAFYDTLAITLDLSINPKFSDPSWNCKVCQERKLDTQRNCPFLDPEEYHEDTYSLQVLDEMVRVCPMNKKDNNILQQAFEARNIRTNNTLPEVGGIGDQTVFFVVASQKVEAVIKHYERKQLEDSKK